jgi:SAM-dependent methyltransferase
MKELHLQYLNRQWANSSKSGINNYLTYLYKLIYLEVFNSKNIIEIGAGAGISKKFLNSLNILRTDLFEFQYNNVIGQINCENLPYPNQSFDAAIAVDVLHHLKSPINALSELKRITDLSDEGKIIIVEPYVSHFSYLIYKFFHSELTSNPWKNSYAEPFINSTPEMGDQALSKVLFFQKPGIEILNDVFPKNKFKIECRIFSILSFFVTGGLNKPLPMPNLLVNIIIKIEDVLPKTLFRFLGSRCIIVIEKV